MAYLSPSVIIASEGASPPALSLLDLATAQDDHLAPEPALAAAPIEDTANPASSPLGNEQATLVDGFGGDFFGQVHLVRSRTFTGQETVQELIDDWQADLSLGNLATETSFDYLVINLDRSSSRDITGTGITNSDGLTLTPDSFPLTLNPFDHSVFSLLVSLDGPPVVDSTITWSFDVGGPLLLVVTGQRIVPFVSRCQIPFTEEIQYKTDIMVSRAGYEQRVAARISPRIVYGMRYQLSGQERAAALNTLFGWGSRLFAVPAWHEAQPLLSDVSAGSLVVPVDTRYADFRGFGESNFAILWRAYDDFEVFEILSRSDNQLDLVRELNDDHPAGSFVAPMRFAYASNRIRAPRPAIGPQTLNINWAATDGLDVRRLDNETPFSTDTYQGDPVLLDPNFIGGALEDELVQDYETFDPDSGGPFVIFDNRDAPANRSRKTWFLRTAEEKWRLRAMLHQLQGRRKRFWLPTFADDLEPTQPLASASAALEAEATEYARYVAQQSPRRDIVVFRRNGAPLIRRIVDSQETAGGVEDFTVDPVWGVDVPLSDITRVSFLHLVRLDADNITIEHEQSQDDARIEIPIAEIIQ